MAGGCGFAAVLGPNAGATTNFSQTRGNAGLQVGAGVGCNALLYSGGSPNGQSENITACLLVCVGAGSSGVGFGFGLDVGITGTITDPSAWDDIIGP